MDSNWPRWIWASTTKYFQISINTNIPIYIEGDDRNTNELADYCEFRMDGPIIIETTKGFFDLNLHINILINSLRDEKDTHKIHKAVGLVASKFTTWIDIFKYGDNPQVDDGSLLGCMLLQGEIDIEHFGQIEVAVRAMQATVSGAYKIQLTG